MEKNYYLDWKLRGGFYRIYSRNNKKKRQKKYVQRQAKEKNQCLYRLFCFCLFLRWDVGGMGVYDMYIAY